MAFWEPFKGTLPWTAFFKKLLLCYHAADHATRHFQAGGVYGFVPDGVADGVGNFFGLDESAKVHTGRIRESMEVVHSSGAAFELGSTCAPGIFGPDDAQAMARLLEPGDSVFLQAYRPGRVLDSVRAAGVRPYVDNELDGLLEIIQTRAPLARI